MAELSEPLINFAKEKVVPLFKQEAQLLYNLPNDVRKAMEELEMIHEYLKKAEILADENENIKKKVKKYRRIMYRLEDNVTSYEMLQQQRNNNNSNQLSDTGNECMGTLIKQIWRCFEGAVQLVKQLKPMHEIASDIAEAQRDLQELKGYDGVNSQVGETFQHQQNQEDPRKWYCIEDTMLFGLDGPKMKIKELLNLDKEKHKERSFLAVTGTPGVGKTTLIKKVYEEVKKEFELHAWVTVSQSYKPEDILKSICKEFNEDFYDKMKPLEDVREIAEKMREYLKTEKKSYIVVLDDVWDEELWKCINFSLQSNQEGSRIILTTRNNNVAISWNSRFGGKYENVYSHEPLPKDDAWRLFCKKAFGIENCPYPALQQFSEKIFNKCAQIPLIINAIGGLLSKKGQSVQEWRRVVDYFGAEFGEDSVCQDTKKIMLYSYHNLPYELKPCFLYFGMFPEDCKIRVDELVHMWVAEGFIKSGGKYTSLEEVAESFMKELIQRGLVMLCNERFWSTCLLTAKRVMVHDVLHEIIQDKLEELEFCQVLSKNSSVIDGKSRRLSVNYNDKNNQMVVRSESDCCGIRSILSHGDERIPNALLRSLPKIDQSLRVLHVQITDDNLESVGNFQNLRLLSVWDSKIEDNQVNRFLKSICQLSNLETLDIISVRPAIITYLPTEISRLCKLRHLYVSCRLPEGVLGSLTELQTLSYGFKIDNNSVIEELKKLNQLRTLLIRVNVKDEAAFCSALMAMTRLQVLYLRYFGEDEFEGHTKSDHLSQCHATNLQHLYYSIIESITRLPHWFGDLHGLSSVTVFSVNGMEKDALQVIELLPCLQILTLILQFGKNCPILYFGSGFQSLKVLSVQSGSLEKMLGALPNLEKLYIFNHGVRPVIPHHLHDKAVFE